MCRNYTFGMYGLTTTFFFFLPFLILSYLSPPPLLLSTIVRSKTIVGKVGRGRSRTIFENFREASLTFFLLFLSLSLFLFYLDENLRRPNIYIYIRKMICLIVRGREIFAFLSLLFRRSLRSNRL